MQNPRRAALDLQGMLSTQMWMERWLANVAVTSEQRILNEIHTMPVKKTP